MKNIISIIVAASDNDAIGINQRLPWRLSADLKRFKALTTGHTVIMGRKTFESLPNGPLPNRRNIVLTSKDNGKFTGCTVCKSVEEALKACKEESEVFIIGGASVYRLTLPIADKIYITRVHHCFDSADTFLPPVEWSEWTETERQDFQADEKNEFSYSFQVFERKSV